MKFENYIHESSLSRVWRMMQEHDSGTITAYRDARDCGKGKSYTSGEKKARNKVLLSSLLMLDFSVTSAKGSYIENYGTPNEKLVGENIFIVVDINDTGILKKTLKKLGNDYEQDSILFIPRGGSEGFLIGTNDCDGFPGYGKVHKLGNPVFGKSGRVSTYVNGRPFILKEDFRICQRPGSGMGFWAMGAIAKGGWKKFYTENKESFESEDKHEA